MVPESKLKPIFQGESNLHNSHPIPRLNFHETLNLEDDSTTVTKPTISKPFQNSPTQVLMLNHRADIQVVQKDLSEATLSKNAESFNLSLFPRNNPVKQESDFNPNSRRPILPFKDVSSLDETGSASPDKTGFSRSSVYRISSSNPTVTEPIIAPTIEQVTQPSIVTIRQQETTLETKSISTSAPKINSNQNSNLHQNSNSKINPRKNVTESKAAQRAPVKKPNPVPSNSAVSNQQLPLGKKK